MSSTQFEPDGRFTIRDYPAAPAFASFLPGIAGPLGIPLWVFYVNRGQAIAAFGVESKDVPIVEFQPANKAYQQVASTGFRTFVKTGDGPETFYEPFGAQVDARRRARRMTIGLNDLTLSELAPDRGLRVDVRYFTLTGEPFAGLARQVTVTNVGDAPVGLSLLDGLPAIVPFGTNDFFLKNMARTAEAWMGVFNVEARVPFYRLRSSIIDRVEVEAYEAGHFYLCATEEGTLLPALVDPGAVFGENTALSYPAAFLAGDLAALYARPQIAVGRTPCGFFGLERDLAPGEHVRLNAVIGHAPGLEFLQPQVARLAAPGYLDGQHAAVLALAEDLTAPAAIQTGSPRLDAYTRQSLLDNLLRGGWPVVLGPAERPFVQHLYSRKHGDLERDYNAFYLAPEVYSQGNGNYRDVNQNRREDVWLNPAVGDYNIVAFMNLLQADGYNPLVVLGNRYTLPADQRAAILALTDKPDDLAPLLDKPFTPGSLLKAVAVRGIGLALPVEAFLTRVLAHADQHFEAEFGEGYWIDHWTYNLDLIENYLAIFPDQKRRLLFEKTDFTFHDSDHVVRPRAEKHVLAGGRVRQLDSLHQDPAKTALIAARAESPHLLRAGHGMGPIFRTRLIVKLLALAAIKLVTQDPAGMGIEMEANRPGWDDALNGLPGLFGSGLPEAFELLRLLRFLREALADAPEPEIDLPVEIADLLAALDAAGEAYHQSDDTDRDYAYWDATATAREAYRERTRLGFDGALIALSVADLAALLARAEAKVADGVARATALNGGLPPTFLRFEVTAYAPLDMASDAGRTPVRVTGFRPVVLPLFLEGPARCLKIEADKAAALDLHRRVKASPLYDHPLGMYRINASLADQPLDIGRARAFTPGWLENESIWTHMEYKYLLALLKAGLVEAFYEDARAALIPFQPPERYGRSPLENSSFLVSSAHPDASLHGRGFVARLSGATVEHLSILHHLMAGPAPFFVTDGQLHLRFDPALAGWLFDAEGCISFTFLGRTRVTYVNPARADTFGAEAVRPVRIVLADAEGEHPFDGDTIPAPYAARVRAGEVRAITIFLRRDKV